MKLTTARLKRLIQEELNKVEEAGTTPTTITHAEYVAAQKRKAKREEEERNKWYQKRYDERTIENYQRVHEALREIAKKMKEGSIQLIIHSKVETIEKTKNAGKQIEKIYKNVNQLMEKHKIKTKDFYKPRFNQTYNYRVLMEEIQTVISKMSPKYFESNEDNPVRKDLLEALKPLDGLKNKAILEFLKEFVKKHPTFLAPGQYYVPDVPLKEIFRRFLKNL